MLYRIILALSLLALAACAGSPPVKPLKTSLVYGTTASVNCTITSATAYTGPVSGNLTATCTGSTPPPVVCTPPSVLENGVCVNPTPPVAGCSSAQTSDVPGLTRLCSGLVKWFGISGIPQYNGPFLNITDFLTYPTYRYSTYMNLFNGATFITPVPSINYISLAITPTTVGSIQWATSTSNGDGGAISFSTVPGQFKLGNPAVICTQNTNSGNSLIVSTVAGQQCHMNIGSTYYINIADVNVATGQALCFNKPAGTCTSSTMSYIEYVSKVQ